MAEDRESNPGTAPFVPDFDDTGEHSVPFVPNWDDTGSQPSIVIPELEKETDKSSEETAEKVEAAGDSVVGRVGSAEAPVRFITGADNRRWTVREMTSNQFVGWNWPLTSLYATGVCIHEFAERIHAVDSSAPSATIQAEISVTFLLTLPSP